MRISVVEDGSCPETEVAIRCKRADKQVIDILARLRMAEVNVCSTISCARAPDVHDAGPVFIPQDLGLFS